MSPPRQAILAEIGLSPLWVRRDVPPVARRAEDAPAAARRIETVPPAARGAEPRARSAAPPPVSRGIAVPDARPIAAPPTEKTLATVDVDPTLVAGMGWEELRQAIAECRACGLCKARQQTVPGVGDENAAWLFIGEAPGAEEDARGEPFVGPAGRLLDAMLAAIGLARGKDVYIANAVKCRPVDNRTPENAEMAACFPYLKRQIALIQPRLIVLLGRAAVNAVLGEDKTLSSLRGKTLIYRDGDREIPVLVTYHPAYLLRNLPDKAKSWEDLCRARTAMRELRER
ncbi:MAG: uracil-DNA glycosylase [Candidatus Accumulibacter sp.]|jgi:DNA polymerase|nr:uracil-DNA glycosylase [Accumulibacter sp.]